MIYWIHLSRGWVVKADEAEAFALVGCAVDKHLVKVVLMVFGMTTTTTLLMMMVITAMTTTTMMMVTTTPLS